MRMEIGETTPPLLNRKGEPIIPSTHSRPVPIPVNQNCDSVATQKRGEPFIPIQDAESTVDDDPNTPQMD
ncbi:MAG: hypothetical protein CMF62_00525 [Magnetococcales bacterium]|nr:hypothetical protein [Magnetococcales bacterium]